MSVCMHMRMYKYANAHVCMYVCSMYACMPVVWAHIFINVYMHCSTIRCEKIQHSMRWNKLTSTFTGFASVSEYTSYGKPDVRLSSTLAACCSSCCSHVYVFTGSYIRAALLQRCCSAVATLMQHRCRVRLQLCCRSAVRLRLPL